MPRKGPAPRRDLQPDPVYRSVLVTQLINKVLLSGKRSIAEKIVYDALDICKTKMDEDPLAILKRAIDNVKPPLEVRSRRVGGATYQVPVEVRINDIEFTTAMFPKEGSYLIPLKVAVRKSAGIDVDTDEVFAVALNVVGR